jgi:dTDP-4-amino-4,6-dideoxygalactose transaminase
MSSTSPKIPLFDLDYGEEETAAVLRVLNSKWLTMGPETEQFEQEFADYIGIRNAIATSNCTTALHLANIVCGIKPVDEVICPSLTFVATVNSILYAGGTPVFADVSSINDWTISPTDIARKITPRTKAILVMHYSGFACDMDAISEIAHPRGIRIIEDAAHGPGAYYRDKKIGSLGDVSCFSFFTNKNVSTGEGGMICTDNNAMAAEIRLLRSHGMTSHTLDRHRGHVFSYDVVCQGYNYRIDEIHAALGREQLKKLDGGNAKRLAAASYYRDSLAGIDQIRVPFLKHIHRPNYHIFPILLDKQVSREVFMKSLRDRGIQTSIHFHPVHTFSHYQKDFRTISLHLTEDIGRREVTLPIFPSLSREQIEIVCGAIRDYFRIP